MLTDSGWAVSLVLEQTQETGPVFTMPMEIGLSGAAGDTTLRIWVDEAHEECSFLSLIAPSDLILDPDHWVLMKSSEVPYAHIDGENQDTEIPYLSACPNPATT